MPAWALEFHDLCLDIATRSASLEAAHERLRNLPRPLLRQSHPTLDHFVPFAVAMGAAKEDEVAARVVNDSFEYGALSMATLAWGMDAAATAMEL